MSNIPVKWIFCSDKTKLPIASSCVGDYSIYFVPSYGLYQDKASGQALSCIADYTGTATGDMTKADYANGNGQDNTKEIDHAMYADTAGSTPNATSIQNIQIAKNGSVISTEKEINFVDSNGATFTVTDDGSKANISVNTYIQQWQPNTTYSANTSFVIYNNILYMCNSGHTSATTFSPNSSYWIAISLTDVTSAIAAHNSASDAHLTLFTAKESTSNKDIANGYAGLDSNGKVKVTELPDSVLNNLKYQGVWDASAGSYPSSPSTGYYYVVSVTGTVNSVSYAIGDWIVYDTDHWDKIDNSQKVSSILGKTGVVTFTTDDVPEGTTNLYFTNARAKSAIINDSGTTGDTTEAYSIDKVLSLLANKEAIFTISSTSPSSPTTNQIWINNSTTPYKMNIYNGTSWIQVGSSNSNATINSWVSAISYNVGDLVIYSNSIYKCNTANSDSTWTSSNWTLIGGSATQIQSDWNQTDNSAVDYIKNKQNVLSSGLINTSSLIEKVNIVTTAYVSGTNIDVSTGAVFYNTASASVNPTFNFRSSSSATLDSVMNIGQSLTVAILITNGTTAYYPTSFSIDGTTVTPKWVGGTSITSGNASSIDSYTFTIFKTASATFTMLANRTQYK